MKSLSEDYQTRINLKVFIPATVVMYSVSFIEVVAAVGILAPFTFSVFYLGLVFFAPDQHLSILPCRIGRAH